VDETGGEQMRSTYTILIGKSEEIIQKTKEYMGRWY
jgi:hypothetical protein